MLYNLLTPTTEEWIAFVIAFTIFFGGLGTGLVFLIIYIVKSVGTRPSTKEFNDFIGLICPFTKQKYKTQKLKDNSYYEEEKEEEKVRMKSAGYGEVLVDTVKVKTGGKWVPATHMIERHTEKTLGYTVLNEYKITEGYQEETSWTAETWYRETKNLWVLENPGSLTKRQQAKIRALCRKRSSCIRTNR